MKYITALLLVVSGTLSAQIVVLNAGDFVSNDRTTINNNFAYLNSFAGVVASLGYTPAASSGTVTPPVTFPAFSATGSQTLLLIPQSGIDGSFPFAAVNFASTNPGDGTRNDSVLELGYNVAPNGCGIQTEPGTALHIEDYYAPSVGGPYMEGGFVNCGPVGFTANRPFYYQVIRSTGAVSSALQGNNIAFLNTAGSAVAEVLADTGQFTLSIPLKILTNNQAWIQQENAAGSAPVYLIWDDNADVVHVGTSAGGISLDQPVKGSFSVDTVNPVEIQGSTFSVLDSGSVNRFEIEGPASFLASTLQYTSNNDAWLRQTNAAGSAPVYLAWDDNADVVHYGTSANSIRFDVPVSGNSTFLGTVAVSNGANVVYRCATAGATLPVGSLTINASACGTTADTGLRTN